MDESATDTAEMTNPDNHPHKRSQHDDAESSKEPRKMREWQQRVRPDHRHRPAMTARAAVARGRPRTRKGGPCSATPTAARRPSRKRPAAFRSLVHDDDDDGSDGERDDEHPLAVRRPDKKRRRSSSAPSFLSSGRLRRRYGGGQQQRPPPPSSSRHAKVVTFSDPPVSAEWTRPRTLHSDVPSLFYSKFDEVRFRREFRLERRLRRLGGWESDAESDNGSDTESESEEDEGVCVVAVSQTTAASESSSDEVEDKEASSEDPNMVTESDSSNSSGSEGDEDEESSDSSEEEDNIIKTEERDANEP